MGLGAVVVASQTASAPVAARDPAQRAAQPVSSRVSGRVLAGDSSQPLHRAHVQLSTGNLQTDRWTSTDPTGAWHFDGVAPGTYKITVSRDGYVTTAYGQKRPYGPPGVLTIGSGDVRDKLDILLPRGGVITGRITDELGQPIGGAMAQAMRVRFVDGLRQLVDVGSGMASLTYGGITDDRGEYRIYGLAPGRYYVAVSYGRYTSGQTDDRQTYPRTYFPGNASIAGAGAVTVTAADTAAASVSLFPTSLVQVTGRVLTARNEPSLATLTLLPVAAGYAIEAGGRLTGRTDESGSFTLKGVPQGEYVLQARGVRDSLEVAATQLGVGSQDVRGVVLITAPTAAVAGKLVVEDPPQGLGPGAFHVRPVAMASSAMTARVPYGIPPVGADGTFTTVGLVGRYALRLSNPVGWWLKSVTIDGKDVTDSGYEFPPGETVTVTVTATRQMGSISGAVKGSTGKPISDCSVVAFSSNAELWGPQTRHIVTTASDSDGTFTLEGVVPGEYMVVAVPALEDGEETDGDRLAVWKASGVRVSVTSARSASVALTMMP
jgi:hypothetical protein